MPTSGQSIILWQTRMNKEILLRKLSPSDVEAYRDIWLEGLKFHPHSFAATYEEWFEKSISQWREHLEFGLVFGGFIGDRLMGIVQLEIDNSERSAYLSHLYVRQSARGKSFAKAMVQYLLDYATIRIQKVDLKRVHLRVVATNIVALRFFARLGFKIYGVTSHQYLDDRIRLMLAISLPVNQPKPTLSHHRRRSLPSPAVSRQGVIYHTSGNLAII